jgi:hypothetical protein
MVYIFRACFHFIQAAAPDDQANGRIDAHSVSGRGVLFEVETKRGARDRH